MARDLYPDQMAELVELLQQDAGFWRWAEPHIVKPLLALGQLVPDQRPQVQTITKRLRQLLAVVKSGQRADALMWDLTVEGPSIRSVDQVMPDPLNQLETEILGHLDGSQRTAPGLATMIGTDERPIRDACSRLMKRGLLVNRRGAGGGYSRPDRPPVH